MMNTRKTNCLVGLALCLLLCMCHTARARQQANQKNEAATAVRLPLAQVLQKLTGLYGINFIYEQGLLAGREASYNAEQLKNRAPAVALEEILRPLGLRFRNIDNQNYAIFPEEEQEKTAGAGGAEVSDRKSVV